MAERRYALIIASWDYTADAFAQTATKA